MDGIHDMGGMHGFGRVRVEANEPVFHEPWHGRIYAMAGLVRAAGFTNIDAFRHAIERLDPAIYLTAGYYGRWLAALEMLVGEAGLTPPPTPLPEAERGSRNNTAFPPLRFGEGGKGEGSTSPVDAGVVRAVTTPLRFVVGQPVRARNIHPAGHTRLPRYVRGHQGVVTRVHPACVFPDTHAHGLGENPQYVYTVQFAAAELWGDDAEANAVVHLDLFEPYLEAV